MKHDWYDVNENLPPADMTTWRCRKCDTKVRAPGEALPNERWGRNVDCDSELVRRVLEA